jgi:hypothetical protein
MDLSSALLKKKAPFAVIARANEIIASGEFGAPHWSVQSTAVGQGFSMIIAYYCDHATVLLHVLYACHNLSYYTHISTINSSSSISFFIFIIHF